MVEIGPNLLAAILALVSLGTAIVAAYRAERAHAVAAAMADRAEENAKRIDAMEVTNSK